MYIFIYAFLDRGIVYHKGTTMTRKSGKHCM